jgi:hypothetical protein
MLVEAGFGEINNELLATSLIPVVASVKIIDVVPIVSKLFSPPSPLDLLNAA